MLSWDEIRTHVKARWRVERDIPTELSVSRTIAVGDREIRQAIGLAPSQVDGAPWLSIIGELFHEGALSPRGALVYADRLSAGAIVLRADRYLVKVTVAFAGLTLDTLDWTLANVAREAVRLRANLLGSAELGARAFDNYSE